MQHSERTSVDSVLNDELNSSTMEVKVSNHLVQCNKQYHFKPIIPMDNCVSNMDLNGRTTLYSVIVLQDSAAK